MTSFFDQPVGFALQEGTVTQMNARPAVCAVLLAVVALLSAGPASADPTDDSFLSALSDYGINLNDATAISLARSVCAGYDSNQSTSVLAVRVLRETNLTARQAGFFLGAATSAYCPQYRGQSNS